MKNVLKLRKSLAKDKLSELSKKLFTSNNISCTFDNSSSVLYAETYYNSDENYVTGVNIGIREIDETKQSFLRKKEPVISDENFVSVIVNMYHEHMHYIQKNQMFREVNLDKFVKAQIIQEIACIENLDNYHGDCDSYYDINYLKNANEIQAEHCGVIEAYNYLCDEFHDIDTKQLEAIVLNIVNFKMHNFTYFVSQSESFMSLDEVDKAFIKAYEDSFDKKRYYFVNRNVDGDKIKEFMRSHPEAKEMYLSAQTALDQDKCMAAINLQINPEWVKFYPFLKTTDLSYETVITKPYHKLIKQSSRIRELNSEFSDLLINDDYQPEK